MSQTQTIATQNLDPKTITIRRDSRQRQENIADVEDLKQSIKSVGIINPLVVRQENGDAILVAGERRLKASLELDLPHVPVRFFNTLTREEAEIVELEENLKRRELSWRDQVKAVGRIHALYRQKNSSWRIEQTAEAVSLHHTQVRKILHVFDAINTGRITRAEGIEQAYNTLHKFAERKAESIVSDLIVKGAAAFLPPPSQEFTPPPDFTTVNAISFLDERPKDAVAEASAEEQISTTMGDLLSDNEESSVEQTPPLPSPPPITQRPISSPVPTDPVICAEFGRWASDYAGPKFTLIHCDFPYGNYKGNDSKGAQSALDTEDFYDNTESVYWSLLDILTANLDKIMSYSAHLIFWFNMNFYTETVKRLRSTGLVIHDHPLIWHKTGGPGGLGVAPGTDATHPRRTYDTALLGIRGQRPLIRSMCNSYAAPTAGNKIHPSQKPEPMLRYFLQMVVDETTSVLDPTCGSAAALRAAEDLGARSILGLEMDANYARDANTKTLQARIMRQAGTLRKENVA